MNYTIGITYNHLKKNSKKYCDEIINWLSNKNIKTKLIYKTLKTNPKIDFIICFGGDGTMLRTCRMVAKYSIPILGINLGTLGFLTYTDLNNIYNTLEEIFKKGISFESRTMLDIEIPTKTKTVKTVALNDCIIRSIHNGRLTSIDAFINKEFLSSYKGDGVLISTPTGSTAYSLALSGPIVYPTLSVFIINPISPHTLTHRPMIIDAKNILEFSSTDNSRKSDLVVSVDGQENYVLSKNKKLKIKLYSKQVKFIKTSKYSYFKTLKTKLKWGV